MALLVIVDCIQRIKKRFLERDIQVDPDFITFAVELLARDRCQGLGKYDLNTLTACKRHDFVEFVANGYSDLKNATMTNIKMIWLMKTSKGVSLAKVQTEYEEQFQKQLKLLIDDILQYPETCSKLQLDQLFAKMQVFIVVAYNLGCPKNHVLLKLTAQALNSVIGRNDLQNYVLKKKYHRLEYLQRLAATVAGIIIYNNDGPDGDRENVRFVIEDVKLAERNCQPLFEESLKRVVESRKLCQEAIGEQLRYDTKENVLTYRCPLGKLQWINQYVITFSLLERSLIKLQHYFDKSVYLASEEQKHYQCVVSKINQTLVMRTAIEAELIFPHFVYLAKVWSTLSNLFNHMVELTKLVEKLVALVTFEMDEYVIFLARDIRESGQKRATPSQSTLKERVDAVKIYTTKTDYTKLEATDFKEFCALTMAVTDGILLPARIQRKLCSNHDITFGFKEDSYAFVATAFFELFTTTFHRVVFTNANLALLFGLDDEFMAQEIYRVEDEPPKTADFGGQTEMIVTNDLTPPNWINVTWNVWDYHRETIHLATIRQCQTRDAQTSVSYGRRNAQNQMYNTRQHH